MEQSLTRSPRRARRIVSGFAFSASSAFHHRPRRASKLRDHRISALFRPGCARQRAWFSRHSPGRPPRHYFSGSCFLATILFPHSHFHSHSSLPARCQSGYPLWLARRRRVAASGRARPISIHFAPFHDDFSDPVAALEPVRQAPSPPEADKPGRGAQPATGGQARQRRTSPPEADKPARGGQARQRRTSDNVVPPYDHAFACGFRLRQSAEGGQGLVRPPASYGGRIASAATPSAGPPLASCGCRVGKSSG
jgi:hypothetical protein